MSLSNKQLAILHVARTKLEITDSMYRATLVQIAGVESAKELDAPGFEAIMGFFEYMGFRPLVQKGPDHGNRPGMASFAQLELIRVLWSEYTEGTGNSDSLNKWIMRTFKVSSLRFMKAAQARKAIVALKAMKQRRAA